DEFIGSGGVDYAGNTPRNIPEHIVNSWLTWAFLPDWEARIGLQWVGSVYSDDDNLVKRPDFTLVNLGLDYFVTEKSAISLRVFKVFDEVDTTGGRTTDWQRPPPRTAELSYRIRY